MRIIQTERILLIVVLITCWWQTSTAQISTHLGPYADSITYDGGHYKYAAPRFVVVTFNVESTPAPLNPTKVNFTLEVVQPLPWERTSTSHPFGSLDDWTFVVRSDNHDVLLLGETLFVWPGPHQAGDKYTNSFTLVPTCSNFGWVILRSVSACIGDSDYEFKIHWWFDQDGKLLALYDPEEAGEVYFDVPRVNFFNSDSLHIVERIPTGPLYVPSTLFHYNVTVIPTPRIGDTSVVHCRLTANKDMPDGCDLSIDFRLLRPVTLPQPLDQPIFKGDLVDFEFSFVPKEIRDVQQFYLQMIEFNGDRSRLGQWTTDVMCQFVFGCDGSLAYATDDHISLDDYSCQSLPEGGEPDYITIKVFKDGSIQPLRAAKLLKNKQ